MNYDRRTKVPNQARQSTLLSYGSRFPFAMSADGRTWQSIGGETQGGHLPPWDLAVRIALAVGGPERSEGRFEWIRIEQGS